MGNPKLSVESQTEWEQQWIPKLTAGIKANWSEPSLRQLKKQEQLELQDFDDQAGNKMKKN